MLQWFRLLIVFLMIFIYLFPKIEEPLITSEIRNINLQWHSFIRPQDGAMVTKINNLVPVPTVTLLKIT